jgi:hypothetical protein
MTGALTEQQFETAAREFPRMSETGRQGAHAIAILVKGWTLRQVQRQFQTSQATGVSPGLGHFQPGAARELGHGGGDAAAGVDGQDARDGQRLARAVGHTDGLTAGDSVVRQQRVKCYGSLLRAGLPNN